MHAQEVLFYIVIVQNKDDEEMYSQLQLSQITIATAVPLLHYAQTTHKIVLLGFIDQDQNICIFL